MRGRSQRGHGQPAGSLRKERFRASLTLMMWPPSELCSALAPGKEREAYLGKVIDERERNQDEW